MISAILHGISSWKKGNTPSPLPIAMDRAFENQTKIGWLQALMEILANNWSETQNLHLKSQGANNPGKIWISLLIRKLWDVSWDFWNFRNHALHATDGPRKLNITELINNRVTCNLKKGSIGLPTRCHLLFHTSIQTLLTRPIRQHLSWIAATTITRL